MASDRTRTALRITGLLMLLGAMAGALGSVVMTVVGKVLAGAEPADIATYLWNLRVFAAIGAVLGPVLGWGALRRVPLWRAGLEPMVAGVVGSVVGFLAAGEAGFLLGSVAGIGLATIRLHLIAGRRATLPPPPGPPSALPR